MDVRHSTSSLGTDPGFTAVLRACLWGLERFYQTYRAMPDPGALTDAKRQAVIDDLAPYQGSVAQHRHIMGYLFSSRRIRAKALSDTQILFYGAAANDEKRFQFFEAALEEITAEADQGGKLICRRYDDLEFAPTRLGRRRLWTYGAVVWRALADLRRRHGEIDPALFQRVRVFFSSFFRTLTAFLEHSDRTSLTIVVANDHSPAHVGIASAARAAGISTIYIQHAAIPAYFPPLDFTMSVLLNEASIARYRARGSIKGDCVVATEHEARPMTHRLSTESSAPVALGVFLPAHPDTDACRALLEACVSNSNITRIVLKPHPTTGAGLEPPASARIETAAPTEPIADLAEKIDVAVFCNSGVALELLHAGVRCFYIPGLDPFGEDLYGFVDAGLTPVRQIADLVSDRFVYTQSEVSAVHSALGDFDPTVRATPKDINDRFKAQLTAALNQN